MVNVRGLIDDAINLTQSIEDEFIENSNVSRETSRDLKVEISIDQSRNLNITGETINNSGAGALSVGDISGTVANKINQGNQNLNELLAKLESAIASSPDLNDKLRTKALKQLEALAAAAKNPADEDLKDSADDAITILEKILSKLPDDAAFVVTCGKLLSAIRQSLALE